MFASPFPVQLTFRSLRSPAFDAQLPQVAATLIDDAELEAKGRKESFNVGGDFNAEVGCCKEHDNSKVVGMCGLNDENARGQWLKQWCDTEYLTIANTIYPKSINDRVTYIGPNKRERQIDYILIDQ